MVAQPAAAAQQAGSRQVKPAAAGGTSSIHASVTVEAALSMRVAGLQADVQEIKESVAQILRHMADGGPRM